MSEQEKGKRKNWTKKETQGFLNCYIARKDEFYQSRKKRLAYENVLKDMIEQGLTTSATTINALETKMRTFLVAYKAAKNNETIAPCIAPFMDKMDEIYRDSPLFNVDAVSNKSAHLDTSDEDKSQISLRLEQWNDSREDEKDQLLMFLEPKIEMPETNEQTISETKRKNWSREETLGFLLCYHARKDEFNHSRKKKYAYENVLKDMIEQGFTNTSTTQGALESKMRSLLQAYRAVKENPTKPDSSGSIINSFMTEMDAIFGDQPTITNTAEDSDEEVFQDITANPPHQTDSSDEDQLHTSSQTPQWHRSDSMSEGTLHMLALKSEHSSGSDLPTISFGKRNSAQEIYFEKKLKLKREEMRDAKLAREAKHEQRERFMRDYLNALQNKWEKDHELDMKKLELLEELINRK